MKNSEIFRKAADYIREHGWDSEASWGRDGEVRCAEGAIFSAAGCLNEHDRPFGRNAELAEAALNLAIERTRPGSTTLWQGWQLNDWNDKIGRTEEQVITLFDSLADDEELKDQIAVAAMQASEFNDVEPSLPPAVKEPLPVG